MKKLLLFLLTLAPVALAEPTFHPAFHLLLMDGYDLAGLKSGSTQAARPAALGYDVGFTAFHVDVGTAQAPQVYDVGLGVATFTSLGVTLSAGPVINLTKTGQTPAGFSLGIAWDLFNGPGGTSVINHFTWAHNFVILLSGNLAVPDWHSILATLSTVLPAAPTVLPAAPAAPPLRSP